MATITYDSQSPGQGARRPLLAQSNRVMKVVSGTFAFDTSYPTGGEDITDIYNQFTSLLGIDFAQTHAPVTANTKVVDNFPVDHAGKKIMAFGDDTTSGVPAQVANTTDLSAITLRFFAWGY